jgi:hypothetical protein
VIFGGQRLQRVASIGSKLCSPRQWRGTPEHRPTVAFFQRRTAKRGPFPRKWGGITTVKSYQVARYKKVVARTAIFGCVEAFDRSPECALSGANASVAGSLLLPWHTKTLKYRVEVGLTTIETLTRKGAAIPGPSVMSLHLFKHPNPAAVDIHYSLSPLDCACRRRILIFLTTFVCRDHWLQAKYPSMALPTFRSLAARRQRKKEEPPTGVTGADDNSERTLTPNGTYTPGINIKLATKTRKTWILLSSLFFFISVIFLILVQPPPPIPIPNTTNKTRLRSGISMIRR